MRVQSTLFLINLLLNAIMSLPLHMVREIEGFLTVKERIDLLRIKKHAHLWAHELLTEKDKLTSLTAAQSIRELSLLTSTLETLTNYTTDLPSTDHKDRRETWGETIQTDRSTFNNYLQRSRKKRNILGDLVHMVTGLATDDQLQQQLRIDETIRDKVTSTLARQLSFEQTMATAYSNLSREEETLHSMISSLQYQHDLYKGKQARLAAYQSIVHDDIDRLEDQIEAVWTGQVNTRHAVFLSSRAGLSQVAAFSYTFSSIEAGLTLTYSARMYTLTAVKKMTYSSGTLVLETMDRAYLLHPAFDINHPISELEVRNTKVDCPGCAKLVHAGHGTYTVMQPGQLTCNRDGTEDTFNVTMNKQIAINKPHFCWNQLLTIGGVHLRLKEYTVDTSGDESLDLLLVHKASKDNSKIETPSDLKTTHNVINLQLRHDLQEAKLDMDNFVVDTSLELSKGVLTSTISWSWMAAISAVVLIFVLLFLLKIRQTCKEAKSSTGP